MSVIRSVHEPHVWHTVDEWLKERPELAVDVYYPRLGVSGDLYFVFTMGQFQQLVTDANTRFQWVHPAVITVIKPSVLPFRGFVNEHFIGEVTSALSGKKWLNVSLGNPYPHPGRSTVADDVDELAKVLRTEFIEQLVWVGEEVDDRMPLPGQPWDEADILIFRTTFDDRRHAVDQR